MCVKNINFGNWETAGQEDWNREPMELGEGDEGEGGRDWMMGRWEELDWLGKETGTRSQGRVRDTPSLDEETGKEIGTGNVDWGKWRPG